MHLVLQFLGLPQVHLDDKPIATDRRKAIALLAYLAVNDIARPHQKYSRESLSALFWPDYEQAKAFSNLRRTIWEVHQTIGDGWLIADRESVHLNEDAEINLDVAQFQNLLSQSRQQNDPELRIPLLVESTKLYRDHFLTGFSLKDAPNFNEWAFAESENLRRKLADALTMLAEDYCALGQADQAITYARRLVTLDQLNEFGHRQLMQVYIQAGQHSAALKQYQTCEQILRKELNLDPQPETRALYKKILKGEMKPIRVEKQTATIAPKHNLPTGTVTFLFTDIENSTKLAQQYPDAMPALLARHHEILNEAFRMHGGYAFQSKGDSFAVAFHSANNALNTALAAQRSLHEEVWSPAPIKVRMGIHTGTADLNDASAPTVYSGYTTMALTQRIMSAGHGGQILISGATENLLRSQLPKNISLLDMGRHRFKDVLQPVRIFQVTGLGLPQEFPSLRALDVLLNNLPAQLTSFVGRQKEITDVKQEVDVHRLVTLTGTGGIGKTRLSLQIAHETLNSFPDGVWFIELAPLSDPTIVPQAIVTTLGLIEQTNRPPQTMLIDFLQAKKSLLILDNCEHLIQACAQLAKTLLQSCPDLHILATSREALEIPGETVYHVPTLTTPDPLHSPFETLSKYEAVQLFVERTQTALAGFTLTRENASAVLQICHHLDGIPLALELAAARVKVLRVEEVAARLDDRFRLLTGGPRTSLPRHQTLKAMIDWSHELLTEPERVLLRRLSVFAGGWTLEAAESVCADDVIEKHEILDLLTQLVSKTLILVKREYGPETRYQMLETIRQYGRERLWAAGEGELMRQQHLAYFVDLAERAEPNLRAFDMVMWLDRLEAELDNIRAALEYASESNVEAQLRLASALLWFWHIRGHPKEGVDWLERGLSVEAAERGDQPLPSSRAMIRGKALNASGFLISYMFEVRKAAVHLEESLTLFQKLGPAGKQGMAYALLGLAEVPAYKDQARSMLEKSLILFREVDDKFGTAECLFSLAGRAKEDDNDYQRAIRLTEERLALNRKIGDRDGIAGSLAFLGILAFDQADLQRAIKLSKESLSIFREVGNKWGAVGFPLSTIADVYLSWMDYEQATKVYEEGLALLQNIGDKFMIAVYRYRLGVIAWLQGDATHATQIITDSLTIFREAGNHETVAESLNTLGDIALAQGDEESATQWYEAELALSQETQLKLSFIFALRGLAKVAWTKGDYDLAIKRFEDALRMSKEAGEKLATFYACYGLGRVAQSQGNHAKARAFYAEALGIQGLRNARPFEWASLKTFITAIEYYPLGGLAAIASTENQMERAARLLGKLESVYHIIRFQQLPAERAEHDQAIAAVRAALGEEAFTAAYEEGKKMTLDDAVAYALKER